MPCPINRAADQYRRGMVLHETSGENTGFSSLKMAYQKMKIVSAYNFKQGGQKRWKN
jgi:hypothetical protein